MAEHFPRDAWYAVGGAAMLAEGEVMPVKLFGEERVAWCGDDGESHVWHNRCIYRGCACTICRRRPSRLEAGVRREPMQKNSRPTHYGPAGRFSFRSFSRPKRTARVDDGGNPGLTSPAFPAAKISFSVALLPFTRRRMPSLSISKHGCIGYNAGNFIGDLKHRRRGRTGCVAIQPVSADKSQIHVTAGQAGAENVIQPLRLRVSAWARRSVILSKTRQRKGLGVTRTTDKVALNNGMPSGRLKRSFLASAAIPACWDRTLSLKWTVRSPDVENNANGGIGTEHPAQALYGHIWTTLGTPVKAP